MKIKRLLAAAVLTSLCTVPAAFAQDTVISPQTVIENSIINDLNLFNNVFSFNYGDSTGKDVSENTQVILPVTVLSGIQSEVVNIINNIVDINVAVDMNEMSDTLAQMRADIASKFNN